MSKPNRARTGGKVPARVPSDHGEPSALERRRSNVHPLAALKHGANSVSVIAPLRTEHLVRLRGLFPNAADELLFIEAQRAAILDVLAGYLDERGLIRNRRTGLVNPAADRWAKTASAFERAYEKLEESQREARGSTGMSLESIVAELDADDESASDEGGA